MDLNKSQKFLVLLKLIEDESLEPYERCITNISKQCIQVVESLSSSSEIEGFIKKDKLSHSPESSLKSLSHDLKPPVITMHTVDQILTTENIFLEVNKNNFIVSIGKGETLISKNGLIHGLIKNGLNESWSVKISSAYINQGKLFNYIDGFITIKNYEETGVLLNFDYFNSKKMRESAVVTTVLLEKGTTKRVSQFVDILQPGRIAEIVYKTITNCQLSDIIQSEESFLDLLAGCLSYSPKIIVIGNVYPVQPYIQQSKGILAYLEQLYANKNKTSTFFAYVLNKEIKKLRQANEEISKTVENQKFTISELKEEKKRNDLESSKIKDKIINLNKEEEMLKLNKEINLIREKYLFKLAEIAELEAKIKELSDLHMPKKDLFDTSNKENRYQTEIIKEFDFLRNDIISQDVGISPIRSLSLTEKTAIDRIETLTKELEDTKKQLKSYKDKEEIMKFKLPENGIDHLSYYELITGL